MTPGACSIHTHSTMCDGKASLSVMAAAAFAAGVRFFGVSGHSHTPIPMDEGFVLSADLTAYRREALRLREKYRGRMEILLGIEQDSLADGEVPADFDYWIGSVHDLYDEETGKYYSIDHTPQMLARCCVEMFHGCFPALSRAYYAAVAVMAERKPTVLGHIDLIAKFNETGEIFDGGDRRYREAALSALHAADPDKTLLEINTGAMPRGYRTTPYPAEFILREWNRMGGRIILTADAHTADAVVYGYETAAELARSAGFTSSVLLTADGQETCRL